jgi:ATP-dependent DNA helicase RecQ
VDDLRPALRELFGFPDFRPGQEQVVRAAVDGRDTLALMPTGSGKSLTYQLAATLRPAPTLVLSPLIALMKDQVDKLPPALAPRATFVNSSLPPEEAAARVGRLAAGEVRLLYAAPERLRQEGFARALRAVGVGLVVVDEVHCVSMWGHDFRPDYLFIRRALAELGDPPVLGMTATATPGAAREIAEALGRRLDVVRTTVVRPNLRYDVEQVDGAEGRLRVLLERLRAAGDGSAIVYARARESCERLARTLRGHGVGAEHYHAGLDADERTRVQDAFLSGAVRTVVATTAFGMGIDKPDVRLVAVVNLPDSLEGYVQMVGRAGRDGAPSDTVLVASGRDATTLRRFVRDGLPSLEELRRVYRALAGGGRVEPETLAAASGPGDAAARVEALLARYEREAVARADRIIGFAREHRCRHLQVAEHFGEALDGPCGACDVCAGTAPTRRARRPVRLLPDDVGAAVVSAVAGLRWPLGRRSLVAMLTGSLEAPPSARRAEAFGLLAGASAADVRRWLGLLLATGALTETETDDGFRVVVAVAGADVPAIRPAGAAPDGDLVERLRAWRRERAQADGVPAFHVLHDATLRALASARPASVAELAAVKGLGPAKIERYADDLLGMLAAAG